MAGIIIEGVTGAGKTRTVSALTAHPDFSAFLNGGRVFPEEETFGEVMAEIEHDPGHPERHLRRMRSVMQVIEAQAIGQRFVLERFHLSYWALLPDWQLYADVDRRLHNLGFSIVLLLLPEQFLAERCLDRVDRHSTGWSEGMVAHFGSRTAAIRAISNSQQRRREAIAKTRLPVIEIDSSLQDWSGYAKTIIEDWQRTRTVRGWQ